MAEFFDGQGNEPFEVDCHIGGYGNIIVPVGLDGRDTYISLSPLEAKKFIERLTATIKEYKEALDEVDADIAA